MKAGIRAEELTELKIIVHKGYKTIFAEYLCITDCRKDGIVLQKGETVAYKWADRKEITEMPAKSSASSRTVKLIRDM